MYKLYRQKNGQVKQVLVEPTDIPPAPPQSREDLNLKFPDPLDAKGLDVEPTFVEQQERQFDLIKQNETQQAKFQTQKLQQNNLQILNFELSAFATGSASFINESFNAATTVGNSLNETIVFSSVASGDNMDAIYYNIVYLNIRLDNTERAPFLFQPSFVEFYPMQKIPGGSSAGGKIPTQISNTSYDSATTITSSGTEFGVQSFGADVYNEQTLYNQSKSLKGIRCMGIALKRINLNFESSLDTSLIKLDVEMGLDMATGGQNY